MDKQLPITVDLNYTPQTPQSTFTPIDVDLSYPNGAKYDERLSVIPETRESMNEWSDNHDVSILHKKKLSYLNSNCGLKSQMTISRWERFLNYISKN